MGKLSKPSPLLYIQRNENLNERSQFCVLILVFLVPVLQSCAHHEVLTQDFPRHRLQLGVLTEERKHVQVSTTRRDAPNWVATYLDHHLGLTGATEDIQERLFVHRLQDLLPLEFRFAGLANPGVQSLLMLPYSIEQLNYTPEENKYL